MNSTAITALHIADRSDSISAGEYGMTRMDTYRKQHRNPTGWSNE